MKYINNQNNNGLSEEFEEIFKNERQWGLK